MPTRAFTLPIQDRIGTSPEKELEQTLFLCSGSLPDETVWKSGNPRELKSAVRYTRTKNALVHGHTSFCGFLGLDDR